MKTYNYRYALMAIIIGALFSCQHHSQTHTIKDTQTPLQKRLAFSPDIFKVKGENGVLRAKGQVLYLPVYSDIPFGEKNLSYALEGVLSIHNTDLHKSISLTQVLYFHNDGYLVKNYLPKPIVLLPLETKHFNIPEADSCGPGANFLVEWLCDTLVNVPLTETIMFSFNKGQGVSFSNRGTVLYQD